MLAVERGGSADERGNQAVHGAFTCLVPGAWWCGRVGTGKT